MWFAFVKANCTSWKLKQWDGTCILCAPRKLHAGSKTFSFYAVFVAVALCDGNKDSGHHVDTTFWHLFRTYRIYLLFCDHTWLWCCPRRWSCFFNTNYRYMFTFYLKKTTCDWYNYIQYIQYTPFYVIKTSTKKNTWEGDYLVLQSKSNYACVPFLSSMTTSDYVYGPTEQPTPSWT